MDHSSRISPSPSLRSAEEYASSSSFEAAKADLMGRLMPADETIPFRWCRDRQEGSAALDVNQTLLLTAAWLHIDPGIAEEIVMAALSLQRPDGLIPARIEQGKAADAIALPLLAQSALRVWNATHSVTFAEYCLPRLERFLIKALDRYDPKGAGYPRYQSAAESLNPGAFKENVASVDLISLLTHEIECMEGLTLAKTEYELDTPTLAQERARFTENLLYTYWDRATLSFKDRLSNGEPLDRQTYEHILPWLCDSIPDLYKKPPVQAPLPPESSPALAHFLAMECYRKAGLGRTVSGFHSRKYDSSDPLAPALLILIEKESAGDQPDKTAPSTLSLQMAQRQPLMTGLFIGFVGLVAALIVFSVFFRKQPPLPSLEAMAALASQHASQGRFDEAIGLYNDLLAKLPHSIPIELSLGNTLMKKGDYRGAENHYRRLANATPPIASAKYNLAVSLYKQGLLGEAIVSYQEFSALYSNRYPELSARAQLAVELLREHSGP